MGAVYKLDATAGRATFLYSFKGGADGSYPYAGVVRDSAGNLYGTTSAGGPAGVGIVYKIDSSGHEHVLYSFTGGADGGNPVAGVIPDTAGNLYGTTFGGGSSGLGVVHKLDSTGHQGYSIRSPVRRDGSPTPGRFGARCTPGICTELRFTRAPSSTARFTGSNARIEPTLFVSRQHMSRITIKMSASKIADLSKIVYKNEIASGAINLRIQN